MLAEDRPRENRLFAAALAPIGQRPTPNRAHGYNYRELCYRLRTAIGGRRTDN
jgi:hypothetical protein